ncbi:hypothetical protein M4I21_04165 [Cellulophaga sp. 20_2_10]|uniref:HYC_CC_PP family protein n=1 Tax=Cellulophaga sp. 20_2_10 TaxID=2942476 RepID=UPI00201AA6A9|nr:hypothetical protein [Cellulophaga sp. 20_2_10]MCL5244988.1 hypothetical protein [Cellulophaga sp. 20_2_10]
MKQVFHKIMSSLLAIVVLFSTMSFAIDMHYCGDTLVETAVFYKAEGCGMEMQKPQTKECSITKKSCCTDEQLVIDGQDSLQLSLGASSFDQHIFITSFVYTYISLFEELEENVTLYTKYNPPLVVKDIFKLDETYLI